MEELEFDKAHELAALKAQSVEQPVAWPVDRDWLWSVLRYARKNDSGFPEIADGKVSLDEDDTDAIIAALNTTPPTATALVEDFKHVVLRYLKSIMYYERDRGHFAESTYVQRLHDHIESIPLFEGEK